jgi:hypothetical protein
MTRKLSALPKISDPRGNLTFIQEGNGLPFEPKRVFWTFNVPSGASRGGHAYQSQTELIVAINGSFEVCIRQPNGIVEKYFLNRGDQGILLPPWTWRTMENFSTNAIGLHLSDSLFNENDYIYDFEDFKTRKGWKNH